MVFKLKKISDSENKFSDSPTLKKIGDVEWEIPKTGKMKVPVIIYASEILMESIKKDDTIKQAMNMASLSGVVKNIIVCPDAHQGYGACIGGVSGMDIKTGVISPGEIGYDINCSVRLLATNLTLADLGKVKGGAQEIIHSLFRTIPSGVGRGSRFQLKSKELDEVLVGGAQWVVEKGHGNKEDYLHTEENGKLGPCNPADVSERAKKRGIGQLGSLGAGNHFLELQVVDEVFDEKTSAKFGLKKGQVCIMIHCGSRGLGHQVASDYIKLMEKEYGFPDFDRELVNAPIKSELGKKYLSAMNCAANFAFANKQLITHWIREDMKHYFPDFTADVVYDVCHNIAKFEEHVVNGKKKKILIMRKGATRSFPGQPVLIPGSMGTASYVLVGTKKAMEVSFGSTAHGAGRVKSRTEARKTLKAENIKKDLAKKGVILEAGSFKGISEEAPQVYKDVDEVVDVSHKAGIGDLVVKLKPIAVMKG